MISKTTGRTLLAWDIPRPDGDIVLHDITLSVIPFRIKGVHYLGGSLLVIIAFAAACLLFPDIFWDGFVWKFYLGPIVADAGGDSRGITSSYNWVDTLTYGVVLAVSAYFIHRLLVRSKLRTGLTFFIALSPVMVLGPALRVLEDMELFNEPVQYLFISPVIYIFLGLVSLSTLVFSAQVERKWPGGGLDRDRVSSLFLTLPGLLTSFAFAAFPSWFNESIQIWPVLLVTLVVCLVQSAFIKRPRWEVLMLLFWMEVLLFTIYLFSLWAMKGDWYWHYVNMNYGLKPGTRFGAGTLVLVLMGASSLLTAVILWTFGLWKPKLKRLLSGINMMIVAGHMLDASATFVGIDMFDYTEKHVLPSNLIEVFGTAAIMFPLKLAFLLPALFLMDISLRKESRSDPQMMALAKLTILVLGLGPGTRDLLRMMLGV